MASFFKNIFKGKHPTDEHNPIILIERENKKLEDWKKSGKTLKDFEQFIEITNEDVILTELNNLISNNEFLKNETDFFQFFKALGKIIGNIKNEKLKMFFYSCKKMNQFFTLIDIKKDELNKFLKIQDEKIETIGNTNNKNANRKNLIEINFKKFDFLLTKFFFEERNVIEINLIEDNTTKLGTYISYINYIITQILNDEFIQSNFSDFYRNFIQKNGNLNHQITQIEQFTFDSFFEIFIKPQEYIDILLNLITNKNKEKSIDELIFYLLPNRFNFEILSKRNYLTCRYLVEFAFLGKINLLENGLKIKELEFDLVNCIFNFLIHLEKVINSRNIQIRKSHLLENKAEMFISFFDIFQRIRNVILNKTKTSNENEQNKILKNFNKNHFVYLDFIISIYEIIYNFNKNHIINNDDSDKNETIANPQTEIFLISDYTYLTLENFTNFEINFYITDELLNKNIFNINSIETNEEIGESFNIFMKNLFDLVMNKTKILADFENFENIFGKIEPIIDENYVFKNKINQLPLILFLQLMKLNTPTKIFYKYLENIVKTISDKEEKNKFLEFISFYFIQYSLENLSDKQENYLILAERFELINKYYSIKKLISILNLKFNFLQTINKKNLKSSLLITQLNKPIFSLKDLIIEEKLFMNFMLKNYNTDNKIAFTNFKKFLFNENIQKFKIYSEIYDFIITITAKFGTTKGLKFYSSFNKDLKQINIYLNFISETILKDYFSDMSKMTCFDLVFFMLKNEKLGKFTLFLLEENPEILSEITLEDFEALIDLFAEAKNTLKEQENEASIETLNSILVTLSKFQEDSLEIQKESSNKFEPIFLNASILMNKEKNKFYNITKSMKFKTNQLLKFLKLKKIFNKNALNIDLSDFDHENFNTNTILEIFIVKKYNVDLITDINDFYSKTTDIREALGLSWDEYLIELSSIFQKYKMHDIYAGILSVFYEKNYSTFERCLLNMKRDKNFDLMKFIFEKKFELKIIENSQNLNLLNQINDYLSGKNSIEEERLNQHIIKEKEKKKSLKTKEEIISRNKDTFEKSDIFLHLDYTKSDLKNREKFGVNYNFKSNLHLEEEYIRNFNLDNKIKNNFENFLKILNKNIDLEKFDNSKHLKGESSDINLSYSLHPKLVELLNNINYNFRGQEFKISTNIGLKAKLYKELLNRNYCAVENILTWENYSFDLKNIKFLNFLNNKSYEFGNENRQEDLKNGENYLIVKNQDEKIFYLVNILSLLYSVKEQKFEMILNNLVKLFYEKLEQLQKENNSVDFIKLIKFNFICFILDNIYFLIKNTKTFTFYNLYFWRALFDKLHQKASESNSIEIFQKIFSEVKTEFLMFNTNEIFNCVENKQEFDKLLEKSDFILDSLNRISPKFNILIIFYKEFFIKFDFNNKLRDNLFRPELQEYTKKYAYIRNLGNLISSHSNLEIDKSKKLPSGSIIEPNINEFDLFFIIEVLKNVTLNNVCSISKLFNLKILTGLFFKHKGISQFLREKFNIKKILSIKLINNLSNLSSFIHLDQSFSFLVFNYLKKNTLNEEEFKDTLNELLFTPRFNVLLEASANLIMLEKNLNLIVKDYFETKINVFHQLVNLFKDKYKISPIMERYFKLIKIKNFICNTFNSNLRNVFSDISDMDNYQDLDEYIKDNQFKKQIYKIYTSSNLSNLEN